MKTEILANQNSPAKLENLYRSNKAGFKTEFQKIYPEQTGQPWAEFWKERLNYESDELSWGTKNEVWLVILLSVLAMAIAKIPEITGLDADYFFPRNIGFVVFPLLTAYFVWKQKTSAAKLLFVAAVLLVSVVYINVLPENPDSDTLILACIHLPLLLWAVLGFVFVGNDFRDLQKRLEFLRYNGDLVVMTAIMLAAGGLLTGLTLGLFELIDLSIEDFYFEYVVIGGLAAAPLVGTYLVRTNPQLVNKVSPVIAKVFTPLLLVTLVIYLFAVIFTGKDPYNDREFLLIFNALLLGVMAIILFSIAETSKNTSNKIGAIVLFALSVVTIAVNGIALSAIVFRISEWGITPNRLAVLGGNLLILANLLFVAFAQFQALKDKTKTEKVESAIAAFLPIYICWALVVAFVFPLLFGFE